MSEQWLGLHNPDRHETDGSLAYCDTCRRPSGAPGGCWPDEPCKCCLVADNEALRDTLARVRAAIAPHNNAHMWQCPCCAAVAKALDGER